MTLNTALPPCLPACLPPCLPATACLLQAITNMATALNISLDGILENPVLLLSVLSYHIVPGPPRK